MTRLLLAAATLLFSLAVSALEVPAPKEGASVAKDVFFAIAANGGNQALYKAAPTRAAADKLLDARLAAPFAGDANDVLYQIAR